MGGAIINAAARHEDEKVEVCLPIVRSTMQNSDALMYADFSMMDATAKMVDGEISGSLAFRVSDSARSVKTPCAQISRC